MAWTTLATIPPLPPDQAHVWRVHLDQPDSQLARLRATLAPDEVARAERFAFPKDRRRYIVGRGALRVILAAYLDTTPADIPIRATPQGKPYLASPSPDLRFNLSHSGQLALIAAARGREVGVDIEQVDAEGDLEKLLALARRFFSPSEFTALESLPAGAQIGAFYACWTRKEAYLKARGGGLSLPLDGFDVSLRPGEPAALLATRDDPALAAHWSLHALDPGPGYAAALAVEEPGCVIKYWDWPGIDRRADRSGSEKT
jgi:4'-phosphopantetheinyl transferase